MTGEDVNRTRSMDSPRPNKENEQEETCHCSRLDGASEILRDCCRSRSARSGYLGES